MDTYISMLRGVNVSGQKKIKMQELSDLYASLGFKDIQTYVQSGNVVFGHTGKDAASLEESIHKAMQEAFGFEVRVFVRTRAELQELVDNNPFAARGESKLHVTFLASQPAAVPVEEFDEAREGDEDFSVSGREIYLFCPDGYGRTKLSNAFFERKLKVAATTRNWRTVNALLSIANG